MNGGQDVPTPCNTGPTLTDASGAVPLAFEEGPEAIKTTGYDNQLGHQSEQVAGVDRDLHGNLHYAD